MNTGFVYLDTLIGELKPGDLIVVGSRVAIGKTSFLTNIAWYVGVSLFKPTAFFCFEWSKKVLRMRLLHAEFGDAWKEIEPLKLIEDAPLFIKTGKDINKPNLSHIVEICRNLKSKHNIELVVIDCLDYLKTGKALEYADRRGAENDEIMGILAKLAQELDVVIILSTNLNVYNDYEQKVHEFARLTKEYDVPEAIAEETEKWIKSLPNIRPNLMNLRHSDETKRLHTHSVSEAEAAIVLLLHRKGHGGEAEVIVAKNKSGDTGIVELLFQSEIGRFIGRIEDMFDPMFGIFWVFTDARDFEEYTLYSISGHTIGSTAPVGCDDMQFDSEIPRSFNHRLMWEEGETKGNPHMKQYTGKPYNHYPRGRVELKDDRATIFLSPHIIGHLNVMEDIKKRFNLSPYKISDVRVVADGSDHYKCWMDWW
jgi:hypothetical protein